MFYASNWRIEPTKILSRQELAAVLADLARRSQRSVNARLNLVVVRLACCCGLRASEISRLRLIDVSVSVRRPHLRIRKNAAKGQRPRTIPLWWDAATLADISGWKMQRERHHASKEDPLVCSMRSDALGCPLNRHVLRKRFQVACKSLGSERAHQLTIHDGRHTFVSHALAGGRTLAEVRDAAGHNNVSVTSLYLHMAVDDDGEPGDLFAFPRSARPNAGEIGI